LVQQRLRNHLVTRVGGEPLVVDVPLAQLAQAEPVLALGGDDEGSHHRPPSAFALVLGAELKLD